MDNKTRIESLLKKFKSNQELNEDLVDQMSRLLYYRYNSLLEAGFTEEHAIKIICHRGIGHNDLII